MATDTDLVALEDLFVSRGVRAYYKGQRVPARTVELNGWQDKVARPTTKAAKEVLPKED